MSQLLIKHTDFGDETYGETENSSNDEDIDPTVEQQHVKKKHSRVFQQNSINSIFAKLQSGLSRSPSIDTNGNQLMLLGGGGPEEGGDESVLDETAVHLRSGNKKKRNWRKAFAQRRKTFTGFTIAEEGGGGNVIHTFFIVKVLIHFFAAILKHFYLL